MPGREWSKPEYALNYLAAADGFPHRAEGEGVLLELLPPEVTRVLDLGTGDGRLLRLIEGAYPEATGVGLDVSEPMLAAANQRFADQARFEILSHDLVDALPDLGGFDVVLSSFAIHHLEHERKQSLYGEVFDLLDPGGIFINAEHVASPSRRVQLDFIEAIGETPDQADPSDRLIDVESQLVWLRELGFVDVDCYWKWREMALLCGIKPGPVETS